MANPKYLTAFDIIKRSTEIRPGYDKYAMDDRRDMCQLARETAQAIMKDLDDLSRKQVPASTIYDQISYRCGLERGARIAEEYATPPTVAVRTTPSEATINEVKTMLYQLSTLTTPAVSAMIQATLDKLEGRS